MMTALVVICEVFGQQRPGPFLKEEVAGCWQAGTEFNSGSLGLQED